MFAGLRRFLLTFVLLACISSPAQTAPAPAANGEQPTLAKVDNGFSPAKLIHHPDPQYSEEARYAGLEGSCVLWLIVGTDGHPRDIKVARTLGKGLDEKAIEAVQRWTFEPARKDGKPVAVPVNVEVWFRLQPQAYPDPRIDKLKQQADSGDSKAEFELAKKYFEGEDVPKDTQRGTQLLLRAAKQGYPQAQFLMGDLYSLGNAPGDPVEAYTWYGIAQRSGYKGSSKKLKALEQKLSPRQLAEARSRIDSWTSSSAK